jgi:cell division septal protein FtsQ
MREKKEISRSEMVRLRREQEEAKELQRAAKEVTRRVPVTTRATSNRQDAVQPKRRTNRSTRRRFLIEMPVARNAFRSVSIPRPRFGWRFLSFILVLVFGIGLYLAFNLPALRVTEAQVLGNQLISVAEVNGVAGVAGQPIFLVKPSDLETRLRLNFPEIVSVNVDVSLPNIVTVNVTERQPLIRWEQGGGYTWVSADGVAFKPRGEMGGLIPVFALSTPPVEGTAVVDHLNPAPFISTEMVETLKGLSAHVPAGVPILYESGMGFGWNDPRGWRVYFGTKASDVELKVRVYESMVNSLTQRGIRPALINVMYPTAPYYRMTQ